MNGDTLSPDRFGDTFRRLVRKAGIGHVRLHDLRHTHASALLNENVHPKVVSERLGHSTIALTLDTYSHLIKGIQEDAADKVGAALSEAIARS